MQWQLSPYLIPLGISTLISLAMARIGWRNRKTAGAGPFTVLMFLIAWWLITYLLEIFFVSLSIKLFLIRLQYIGISLVPVYFFKFVLHFKREPQHPLLAKPQFYLFYIIPLVVQFGLWTHDQFHLFYSTATIDNSTGFSMLETDYGPLFWLNVTQAYLLLAVSTILIIHHQITADSAKMYRNQIWILLLGMAAPWLANLVTVTNLSPYGDLDLTPFAFTITGVAVAWGLFRYKFLDIAPVARNLLVKRFPEGVLVLDERQRVVDLNPAMERILKRGSAEVWGEKIDIVFSELPEIAAHLRQTDTLNFEFQLGGSHYAVNLSPLDSEAKAHSGVLALFYDISKQKKAEEYLRTAKTAAESAQQQAEQARETAVANAKAKDSFLTTMSHEIRTPVNAIVGTGQLLRDTHLTGEQKELVDTIQSSSDLLLTMINNILDFSMLEAGNLKLSRRPFSLRNCVENVCETMKPSVLQKNLHIETAIDSNLPPFFVGDVVRLRQILLNLLQNSVKFSEKGRIFISVTGQEHEPGNYTLAFTVTDEGIGIPQEKVSQLFQSFHQVDGSLTRAYGGIGLGLAIANKLCRLMNGRFSVQSEVDQGSRFKFTIKAPVATERPSANTFRGTHRLSGKRMLIVSKDQSNRRRLSSDARAAGMETYVASGATDTAYWLQKSDEFDLLLVDAALLLKIPDLLDQVLEIAPDLPVVLLKREEDPQPPAADLDRITQVINTPLNTSLFYDALHHFFTKSPVSAAGSPAKASPRRDQLQILLVEDNRVNQRVAENLLKKLGYLCDLARNGQEALDALEQKKYDVILMDIQMPVMDGLQATRAIRKRFEDENQPYIIAVTAHALEGDREYYLSSGMDYYISKPIQTAALVEALHEAQPQSTPGATPPNSRANAVAALGDALIDFAELELMMGEPADQFLQEMSPIFIADAEALLVKLRTAVAAQNDEQIRRAAHTLKGTSASLGMVTLSTRSKELEFMAKDNDLTFAQDKLTEIESAFQQVKKLLPYR